MASSNSRTSEGVRPSIRSMNSNGISWPPWVRVAPAATDGRLPKFTREMPAVVDLCFSGMGGPESNRVELRHLRVFEAVARLKSFTHAADELSITQPALSRTIRQLEDGLGVTLLDRSSRHMETTPAGRTFLEHVERILAELDRGFAAVRRLAAPGDHSPRVQLAAARPLGAGHRHPLRTRHRDGGQPGPHRRRGGRRAA